MTATSSFLVQMALSLPRLGMYWHPSRAVYFENTLLEGKIRWSANLSGCHWENQVVYMWIWMNSMVPTVYVRVNQVSVLQSPAASIHTVRWVRSSYCGTNDWPAGRGTKSGEEPTSGSQQETDSEWGWTEDMYFLSLCNSPSAQLCSVEPLLSLLSLIFPL